MLAKDSPDELPSGWTVLCKVLRTGREVSIYTNLETGKRFFSKDDLFKHIKSGSSHSDKPLPTKKEICRQEESTTLKPEPVNENDEHPKWLPEGWKIEVRFRKSGLHSGKEYKCYIEPSNSGKFYSKQEVLRYLEVVKRKDPANQDDTENQKRIILEKENDTLKHETDTFDKEADALEEKTSTLDKETITSMESDKKVDIQKCVAEDLPSGWTKEIRIRQSSTTIRKDPYYTDPVSGYVFRSKKEALRYVKTGVIGKHAFKPKKSQADDSPELMKEEVSTSSAATMQKSKNLPNKRQLFSGKKGSEMTDSEPSITESSKISSAEVSRDEIFQGKRPLDDTTQVCGKSNNGQSDKKCAKMTSPFPENEGSKRGRDKSSPFSDSEVSEKGRVAAENGLISTPAQENASAKEARVNPRKSTGKKAPELPPRSSKRLAGHEPDKVANLELGERAVISAIKKAKKTEAVHDINPTSDSSVQVKIKKAKKTEAVHDVNPTSDGSVQVEIKKVKKTEAFRDVNPTSGGSKAFREIKPEAEFSDRASDREQNPTARDSRKRITAVTVETEKTSDDPEPQFSLLFGSDPCLEFAFKTLTGELPLEDNPEGGPAPANAGNSGPRENSLASTRATRSKSKNKREDLSLPRRSSKRLSRCEPESASEQQAPWNSTTKPHKKGSSFSPDLLGGSTRSEPSDQRERPSEPTPQSQEPEIPGPDLPFSIADYWSDPCLDFAFKTLTGVIPIEDSLVQGYFQEQVDVSNCNHNRNGSVTLPDFGSSNLFQTDVSAQFDGPEKSSTAQQVSLNVGFPSCSNGLHSQQQSMEGNKDLHQKVKS